MFVFGSWKRNRTSRVWLCEWRTKSSGWRTRVCQARNLCASAPSNVLNAAISRQVIIPGGAPAAFTVTHSNTGSAVNANLPTALGLSPSQAVSVTTPAANTTKWKTTLNPTTGAFTGSFELLDGTQKRSVGFSGVLRQPSDASDTTIGEGHYLLPPLVGSEQLTGELIFSRP